MTTRYTKHAFALAMGLAFGPALGGCVSVAWPPFNGGGIAEIAPPQRHHIVLAQANHSEATLLSLLESEEKELAELIDEGARQYAAAETSLAVKLTHRIRREIAGTLYSEAEADLVQLRDRIEIIDRSLFRVRTGTDRANT